MKVTVAFEPAAGAAQPKPNLRAWTVRKHSAGPILRQAVERSDVRN